MHLNHAAFADAFEMKTGEGLSDEAEGFVAKALADLNADVLAKLADAEKKSAARLDKIEAKLGRPAIVTGDNVEATVETKAFDRFLRRGEAGMAADEVKNMTLANDASGGYLAPEALASSILTKLVEFSPIRSRASVMTIGAESVKFPRQTGVVSAFWVGETDDRTATQPAFDQTSIKPFELAAYTDLSVQLLEDNSYNLESFLSVDFAKQFARTEGLAFVKGTGAANNQPTGLMTVAGISEVKTGAAANFPAANPIDVLIGMETALPTAYRSNAAWLMNSKTLGEIRKWKDGQGYPFVLNPVTGGFSTLLGYPVIETPDMDDLGAGKNPIMFGDLSGYRIVDRVGFTMLRDPYTLATKGQVRIHVRKRVGGDVLDTTGFVKLKVAA